MEVCSTCLSLREAGTESEQDVDVGKIVKYEIEKGKIKDYSDDDVVQR